MKNKQPLQFLRKGFIITLCLTLFSHIHLFAQGGIKWATGGNGVSTGDFIGTTNNFPLLFKTNNALKMQLSTSGVLQINNLSGTGNRLLQTDASGNISPFAMGTSTQVLYGNGTWGALPAIPAALWNQSGSNLFYTGGNVGIGTSSPAFPLDVIGDARISNNLYVGGGIVITDKVNAASQVTTSRVLTQTIKADSILMDSTKAIYGTTNFVNGVKLQNKLDVAGNAVFNGTATVNGAFKTTSNITFAGDKSLSYYPPTATTSEMFVIDKLGPLPVLPPDCGAVAGATGTVNLFHNEIKCWGFSSGVGAVNVITMGYDGVNGVIDVAGDNGHGHIGPDLLVNNNCGKNIYMCTGANGGFVSTGKNFEVGIPVRDANTAVNVNANNQTALLVTSTHTTDNNYNTKLVVNRDKTKALAVYNSTTSSENFIVYGDGKTIINGSVGIGSDLTDPSNATFKLCVNGNVRAKKAVVETGWSDFVFENKYKLRSLKEVENYITQNGHLPEIPSATEIGTKGADIGEILKLQMQKIEELTLYIIDLNKKLIAQNEAIEILQKK